MDINRTVATLLRSLATTTVAVSLAQAQERHLTFVGEGAGWQLSRVDSIGDIDGDGVNDLVLGSPGGNQGAVRVVSGADGELLLPPTYGPHHYNVGFRVAGVGDFDGDGTPDFASGVTDIGDGIFDGQIRVWSGRTGELIVVIPSVVKGHRQFGFTVFGVGDLDGDGCSEIAGGFRLEGDTFIYSGPDAEVFRIHREGLPDAGSAPARGASIGDVDGDQVPDYALAWRFSNIVEPYGLVAVFSGKTGKKLYKIVGDPALGAGRFGTDVAALGDVSGDGIPDFAVSDFQDSDNECDGAFPSGAGYVDFYSGVDGQFLKRIEGSRIESWAFGCSFWEIDGGHDVNGDGIGDLITVSPWADEQPVPCWQSERGGITAVYSGSTGTMLWRMWPGVGSVSLVGDLTGDGLSEFAWGNIFACTDDEVTGRVTILRGAPGDAQRVCTSTPNSTGQAARIGLEGPISIANNLLHLWVDGAVPGGRGAFFYGPELTQQPFGDGFLCVGGGNVGLRRIASAVSIDANGSVLMPVDMRQKPTHKGKAAWRAGSTHVVQFWFRDPTGPGGTGFNLSDAMQITFTQ